MTASTEPKSRTRTESDSMGQIEVPESVYWLSLIHI